MHATLPPPSVDVDPLTAAPVRKRRDLPRLFFIADGFITGRAGMAAGVVCERTVALVEAGVPAVQLRDHRAAAGDYADRAAALVERLRSVRPDVLVSVNSRPEVAQVLGTALHVGRRGPSVEKARRAAGADGLVGYSAHSPSSAWQAALGGVDYVFVSPLFQTPSHPEAPPAGLPLLRRTSVLLDRLPDPPAVYALGGIAPENVQACLQAGAHGVVSLSRLLTARDTEATVRGYLDAFAVA